MTESTSPHEAHDDANPSILAPEYLPTTVGMVALVVDYFHWRNGCGSFEFDEDKWPDPDAMIDAMHQINVKVMVSVWPSFQPGNPNFEELDAAGQLFV